MNANQAKVTAGPKIMVEPPLAHVRCKWMLVSTGAWVAGGGIAFALGTIAYGFLLAFGVSGFLGDLANALTEAFSFVLAGVAVALGQWLAFRRTFEQARDWLLASTLAWIPAGVLASLAYELFLYLTRLTSGDPDRLRVYASAGMFGSVVTAAIMVGAWQWLALRRAFLQPGRWIPASTVAWFLGIGLTLLGGIVASLAEGCLMGFLVFPAAGGLVSAAITGQVLVRLVQRAAAHLAEKDCSRRPALALAGVSVALLAGGLGGIWALRAPYAATAQGNLPEGCPPSCASTELSGLNLRGAHLRGADLSGADLWNADLTSADLSNTVLSGADLAGALLEGTALTGARYSAKTIWPAGLIPAADMIEMEKGGCYTDEEGQRHCYGE